MAISITSTKISDHGAFTQTSGIFRLIGYVLPDIVVFWSHMVTCRKHDFCMLHTDLSHSGLSLA